MYQMAVDNKLNLKLIFFGVALGLATVLLKGTVVMLGVIIITGIILWNFLPEPDRKFLVTLYIAGMSLRIIIFAIFYIISVSHGGSGELIPDSRLYSLKTLLMMKEWAGQTNLPATVEAGVGDSGLLYILAFFYKFLGYEPASFTPTSLFSDKLINCLIGTITAIPLFYISKDIFGRAAARITSCLIVFYPSLVLWSMTNNRDTPNIFLVSLILFCLIRSFKGHMARNLAIIFISLLCLWTIRPYILFCILGLVGISYLFFILSKAKNKSGIVLFLIISCLIFLNFTGYGKKLKRDYLNLNTIALSFKTTNDGVLAQGGSVYRIYDGSLVSAEGKANITVLMAGFLKGWFYFMLVPFPWSITTLLQVLSYPQIIIWYILLYFAVIGIIIAIRYRFIRSFVILGYIFIVTSGFALSEGNIGSTLRHRDLITPFYFIFTSVGLMHVFKRGGLVGQKE